MRRLKPGFGRATANLPILKFDEQTWTGHHMSFKARALGQAVSGTVDVSESDARLEVRLPWLLRRFAELVRTRFKERTMVLLEKR
jgi:hypothetical protein